MTREERKAGGRLSRGQTAIYSGLVGGAVGMAVGTRLRRIFGRRGAAGMFQGTPCSTLPAEGGGDPVSGPPARPVSGLHAHPVGDGTGGGDSRPE